MSVDPVVSAHMCKLVERRNRKYGKKWRVALAKKGEGGSAGKKSEFSPS